MQRHEASRLRGHRIACLTPALSLTMKLLGGREQSGRDAPCSSSIAARTATIGQRAVNWRLEQRRLVGTTAGGKSTHGGPFVIANQQLGADSRTELTVRGIVLGVVITLVFTAANVFFGLKAGLTFSTSIPAAVISMAILRSFQNVTMQENNIVQTVASAAGTLSSIIFVLPGLVMIRWWTGFPYWVS